MDHIKTGTIKRERPKFTLELLQITPTDHGNEFYTVVDFEAEKDWTN